MNKLIIATKNSGKAGEYKKYLSGLGFEVVNLLDKNILEDVDEDGKTYEENSIKKALFYAKLTGFPTIGDDAGIEIAALGGEPGVRSRRWLGHHMSDEELIDHMLKLTNELPDNNRKAFFRTVVTLGLPNGKSWSVEGNIEGIIAKVPNLKFVKGYPFRSFFYLPQINKFHMEDELTEEEQKLYNHRYIAIQKIIPIIKKYARH